MSTHYKIGEVVHHFSSTPEPAIWHLADSHAQSLKPTPGLKATTIF